MTETAGWVFDPSDDARSFALHVDTEGEPRHAMTVALTHEGIIIDTYCDDDHVGSIGMMYDEWFEKIADEQELIGADARHIYEDDEGTEWMVDPRFDLDERLKDMDPDRAEMYRKGLPKVERSG